MQDTVAREEVCLSVLQIQTMQRRYKILGIVRSSTRLHLAVFLVMMVILQSPTLGIGTTCIMQYLHLSR